MLLNPKKQKLSASKKTILVLVFALFFSFSPIVTKEANAWMTIPSMLMDNAFDEIMYTIKSMIMGSLQQAAIKMISKQADRFLSGVSSNGARFITNWEDYLIDNPTRNTQRYANDYISRAFSGRGSVSYKKAKNSVLGASTIAGEGFGKEAVLGDASDLYAGEESYQEKMQYMLQDRVINPPEWQAYTGEPSELFQSQTFAEMNDYIENGLPAVAQMNVANEYEKKLEEEKSIAAVEANANSGFISEKVDGMVSKPGKLFEEMQANVDNLPNLAIAGATSIGQLIAATASTAISKMFDKAVSGVERTINREVGKVTNKATKQVNQKVNSYGPGALYK